MSISNIYDDDYKNPEENPNIHFSERSNNNTLKEENNQISSIKKKTNVGGTEPSKSMKEILQKDEKKSYHCKNCKTFPLIKIKDNYSINFNCFEMENNNINLDKFFKDRKSPDEEKIKKLKQKLRCQNEIHENEDEKKDRIIKYYCFKCKKDLCEECYNICSKDQEHINEKAIIKKLDELNEERKIKEKEHYIEQFFEKEFKYKPKDKIEDKIEMDEKTKTIRNQENKAVMKEKEENKQYLDLTNIWRLYKIIAFCKDKFPSYSHIFNIEQIYFYLLDKIEIIYSSEMELPEIEINIFGKKFVENNKNNCSLIINDQKVELCERYKKPAKEDLKIILVKENPIEDASEMFKNCDFLTSVKIVNQWIMDKVKDMNSMFYECTALYQIKIFSDWNTSEVKDFSNMFYKCESLNDISDPLKFNTENAESFNNMFYGCEKLGEIKGISEWNTNNVTDMSSIFYNCYSLKDIDLSKWDMHKVTNTSNMFYGCESLKSIKFKEDLNTKEVVYMNYMFTDCTHLEKLIGLSNWDTEKVLYMNNMFQNCQALEEFSDISNWNIKNVVDFNDIFDGFSKHKNVKKPSWYKKILSNGENDDEN